MNFEAMTQAELGETLENLYQNIRGPFPYDDCRRVNEKYGATCDRLWAKFASYSMDICGCASSTRRFFTMPEEEIRTFQFYVERPFFEEFPQYQLAENFINAENTPDLHIYMEQTEQMRVGVRLLLAREVSHQK